MAIVSQNEEERYLNIIRQHIVEHGYPTIPEVQKIIQPIKGSCTSNYAVKLRRIVDIEDSSVAKQTVTEEISRLEREWERIRDYAISVQRDPEADYADKTNAEKLALDAGHKLYQAKFDAGLFKRNLGEINANTKNLHVVINLLDMVNGDNEEPSAKDSIEVEG